MMFFLFLFVASFSFYLGQNLPYWMGILVTKIQNERLLRKIRPTEVDEDRLCKEPHDWFSAPHTVDENGEYTRVNVCKNCGVIPALNTMATVEGLEYIEKNKKLFQEEEKIKQDFLKLEEEGIRKHFKEELDGGMQFDKLAQIYHAGQNMKERFILYKVYKAQQNDTELNDERRN